MGATAGIGAAAVVAPAAMAVAAIAVAAAVSQTVVAFFQFYARAPLTQLSLTNAAKIERNKKPSLTQFK